MPTRPGSVRTITQVSSGGAVLRRAPHGLEIALISVGSPPRWQLPKGLIEKGETPENAAIREVREEAGIEAAPASLVDKVEYWYQATHEGERVRYHKFVYFFMMWFTGGDVADHDNEVNEARWLPAGDAMSTLAFKSEKAIVEKAVEMAAAQPPQG